MNPPVAAGVDGPASDALLKLGRFFTRWEESDDGRVAFRKGGRAGDVFYRDRWSHDKVVRSTHGVNCTGSCSWKIYVRDGIITEMGRAAAENEYRSWVRSDAELQTLYLLAVEGMVAHSSAPRQL